MLGTSNVANQVLLNDGTGIFARAFDLPGITDADTSAVLLADINRDGSVRSALLAAHGDPPGCLVQASP